jgi:EpsI family protein
MTSENATPIPPNDSAAPTPAPAVPTQDPATMGALFRRTLVLVAILVPAVALTIVLVISEHRSTRAAGFAEKAIPATIETPDRIWTSSKLEFSEDEMRILETRDYVYRTYIDSSEGGASPVELCVVFSEDNRKGTHPPDVCLEATGFRILSRQDRIVAIAGLPAGLKVRELVTTDLVGATPGGRYLYFVYFYKCGDSFTTSFYNQQIQIVWNGLTQRNAAGALVRYSTPMANFTDVAAARAHTDQLIALTFPYIRDNLR